jgi:SAM-dependent methyltransferase
VLCNAAFWHFPDPDAVLREVRAVLSADGRFVFNLPDQVFDFADGRGSDMTRVVAACLDQPLTEDPPEHSEQTVRTLAVLGGFSVVDFQVLEVRLAPEDLLRFDTIPHVGARRFPALSLAERRRRFTAAFARLPLGESVPYRWAQFTLAPLPKGAGRW